MKSFPWCLVVVSSIHMIPPASSLLPALWPAMLRHSMTVEAITPRIHLSANGAGVRFLGHTPLRVVLDIDVSAEQGFVLVPTLAT